MKTIIIDPGHGGSDPGAIYGNAMEKTYNLTIALRVRDYLQANFDGSFLMTRTNDTTVSLSERSNFANSRNADFFLSIHNNAAGGTGFESYIYNGTVPEQTKNYQNSVHNEIMSSIKQKYGIKDRGKKRANFHVLRETEMSSILLEVLFIDNPDDLKLLNDPLFIPDVSAAIAKGVAKALALAPKNQDPSGEVLYKVIAGSFTERRNAEERVNVLSSKGIASFIVPAMISNKQTYRVQVGAYKEKENADARVDAVKQLGMGAFIITENEGASPPKTTAPPSPEELFTISGDTLLTPHQLDAYVRSVNPEAPSLGQYYEAYGKRYGMRGDAAFAQAILETDYFRFTGLVKKEQNNYAGIGATGPGNPGAVFSTPEIGVHAHIQHLYAYASTDSIPAGLQQVDPRFNLVTRGISEYWTSLNGRWAVPGTSYGQDILGVYRRMINLTIGELDKQKQELNNRLEEL
ncbi:sporulation protein [Rossellomorea vietnamensis]|uniref:Sporulation protein n=1 Tax=Rossellomorea vietnamensis TaxID=218284 RepID=A0A5D4NUP0_9BACI|nr:N-acetylmuramoyl-L-alanine amidase [Rossellomorea vietnamensis]TYS17947.1 sporulation protein [Rossellomorea vietnamensis]